MTDRSFDLISEPWIVVLGLDGRQRTVSLDQLIADAHTIRAIVGEVPTQAFALLRLVLAILHRAWNGPPGLDEWARLWTLATLPVADVHDYLAHYRERFDLLHPTTPFYQVADLRTDRGEINSVSRVVADMPSKAPLFASRIGPAAERLSCGEAARWLVHCQAFDVSGIKSGAVGDPRVKGSKGYPIGTGQAGALGGLYAEGATLRDTLLLNLIPDGAPYLTKSPEDLPVWERAPQNAAEDGNAKGPYGPIGLYTWQSRRIRLFTDDSGVYGVLVANGDRSSIPNTHAIEPLSAWRRSTTQEKARGEAIVYMPRTHDETRTMWRGLAALLPGTSGRAGASQAPKALDPLVLEWLGLAVARGYLPAGYRVRMHAIGMIYGTQQSVVDEIVDDELIVTAALLPADTGLAVVACDAVADAENGVRAITYLAQDLVQASGGSGQLTNDARDRSRENAYAALDRRFRPWLAALASDSDETAVRVDWQKQAYEVLSRLGDQMITQAGPSAWAGRAVAGRYISSAAADLRFRRALRRALSMATEREVVTP